MGEQAPSAQGPAGPGEHELVGQWRARLDFEDGDFAAVDGLEFMYVFNAGGTLTESSNYDAAPPVPPAYGVWRRIGPDRFEVKYEFYPTRPPAGLGEITSGGGWLVAGRGVFTEVITIAAGGDTFTSTMLYELFDTAGNPVEGGGTASGRGVRLRF